VSRERQVKRYQTAEELVADLTAVEQAFPLTDRALSRAKTKTRASREITVKLTPRKVLFSAAAIMILAASAAALYLFVLKKRSTYPPPIENSFIVVGFENQTGDESQNHLRATISSLLRTKFEQTGVQYVVSQERMNELMTQIGKKKNGRHHAGRGF